MTQTITIREKHFTLHPSGAIYWHEENMLLIADVHFGKVAHFRKHGAAVPQKASEENFRKLNVLVDTYQPGTICFLGDLFHSTLNNSWKDFTQWVKFQKSEFILISGNHDIIPKYLFEELGVIVYDELLRSDFLLTHHPIEDEKLFNLSGHIHPGVRLQGVGRQYIKLPCFFKTEKQMILPAFGNFTGKYILTPTSTNEVFAIADDEVICVSTNS
ncbi:ligase-associated DNA damage response endonuclease PdeM [Cochleicola gelatinilyticus]|uniref:Metallophosphoesterase n=1 Tax=Cochleicola gelatinilyticus TaxID=1763537 RepID=A0A167J7P8_9FLAO|nr:ligase-associated DNA damage response endonuclease PdeM [Cochleicola gelatinilyticus]OAB80405.1 metallophosphoesterase [Cochleicola gelatinilyticus]